MKARTILAAMAAVLMTSAAANAAQLAALVGNDTIAWVDTMQKKATGMTKVTGIINDSHLQVMAIKLILYCLNSR